MKIRTLLLIATHGVVGFVGFVGGIYSLPILTAPPAPDLAEVRNLAAGATYTAEFRKDLQDSDFLHWGEGTVAISPETITLTGELAPGPDYKLYLSPQFVETESDFNRLKADMVQVGDIRTFQNFIVSVPADIAPSDFNTVIVWCEAFGQFISSAQYQ